jgi:hypothetical protein
LQCKGSSPAPSLRSSLLCVVPIPATLYAPIATPFGAIGPAAARLPVKPARPPASVRASGRQP